MSALYFIGSATVFAIYSDDERSNQTVRTRHDLEKSV